MHYGGDRKRIWNAFLSSKSELEPVNILFRVSNILNFVFHKDSYGVENPTHHGEVQFSVEDGRLFTVTSFKGDAHTGYVCFQASKASLSQNGKSTWNFSRVAQFVRKFWVHSIHSRVCIEFLRRSCE